MTPLRRVIGALLAGFCVVLVPASLSAQTASPAQTGSWPQRPVRFILPLGPGSGADIGARLFADRLSAKWSQPVVVENRAGGDGVIAINAFITARDDHTLLYTPTSSFTAHPYQHDKLPYDPRELSPVARASVTLVALVVPSSLNVSTTRDLIEMAKAQPGKLNYTTATGMTDVIFDGYFKSAGIAMTRVPYRDTVQALNDLGEGRIQAYVGALAIVQPHVQAGRVKLIAITNAERAPTLPDLPTVAQAGYPALTFDGLVGLFGQRDMPAAVRDRIAADVRAVATDQTVAARLTATGQVIKPGSAAEFAASIEEQRAKLAAVAKELGIKAAQ
jgi:tripartite-type tricarboxylate transporter receptor subunit TctC